MDAGAGAEDAGTGAEDAGGAMLLRVGARNEFCPTLFCAARAAFESGASVLLRMARVAGRVEGRKAVDASLVASAAATPDSDAGDGTPALRTD